MYERPTRRPVRGAVSRADVEEAESREQLAELLIDLIQNDERVRAALLKLTRPRTAPAAQSKPPTRGRSR